MHTWCTDYIPKRDTHIYHKLWSISTGISIRKLHIFAVQTTRGTYNHGVLFIEVINTVVGLFLRMSALSSDDESPRA